GRPFSSHGHGGTILPSAEHFVQLVSIVQTAHSPEIYLLHRDLSLANFFLGPDGKVRPPPPALPRAYGGLQVFLNDWAAAVPLGEVHPFFGALCFAADSVLEQYGAAIESRASHDLE